MTTGDWGGIYHERAEIFDTVRDAGITGFAIVAGDRHSFWAGGPNLTSPGVLLPMLSLELISHSPPTFN